MPRAVVVIDVLRAFTTAVYAAERGASAILLAGDVAAAQSLRTSLTRALILSDGARRDDVDLVNSPALIRSAPVNGRPLVMTTTNGTRAALEVCADVLLLCASFVNAAATAALITDLGIAEVTYIASGGPGAAEDIACGEYIAALVADPDAAADRYLDRVRESAAWATLERRVAEGDSGVHPEDVAICAQANTVPLTLVGIRALGTVMLVAQRTSSGAAFNC